MTETRLPPELELVVERVLEASGLELSDRVDVARDLRAHFEDGLAAGVSPGELARRFGDPAHAGRRIARARRGGARSRRVNAGRWWMSGAEWWSEVRRSARSLLRTPAYAAVVVTTLALGVGANTAVFSVVDAVLLQALPYAEPGELVRVYTAPPEDPSDYNYLRGPAVVAYRTWDDVFQEFGALYTYRELGADLTDGDQPRRITVMPVTPGYFPTLGVEPILGRTFTDEESAPPGEAERGSVVSPVVLLSHALWRDHLGGDRDAVGRTVILDGVGREVVGVMPPGFQDPFGSRADAWVPQDLRPGGFNNWGNYYLSGVARLRPGLSLEAAQERATALYRRLAEAEPQAGDWGPRLVPLQDSVVGSTREAMLWLLAGAAALVLLSACVNVANLVFARGLARTRTVVLRAALGSGRGRLVAHMLTESALLAGAGGTVGLALGWAGVRGLLALAPDALPLRTVPTLSPRVFLFALGASGVALGLFAVAPAVRLAGTSPAEVLRAGDGRASVGRGLTRLRGALVVLQVAAGLVLLVGAGLLTRSFLEVRDVNLGIATESVLTFEVHLPPARYPDGSARDDFHREFHERVATLPGVEAAGATSWLPVNGRYHQWAFGWRAGESPEGLPDEDWYGTDVRIVAGDYFEVMDIELRRGAGLQEVDLEGEPVVWVNQALVDRVMPDVDPLAQRINVAGQVRRVVGVVESVPFDIRGATTPECYIHHAQYADNRNWALIQTVRTRGDIAAVREAIRVELSRMDPSLVLHVPRPFGELLSVGRARDRFATVLMGAFAVLALALTLVGTYGVLSRSVAGRSREIGIRMALGADGASVRSMVIRYALGLTAPGIALGLVGALGASRLLSGVLFDVRPGEPTIYATMAGVLFGSGIVAGWLPARRAARVDPARALAQE